MDSIWITSSISYCPSWAHSVRGTKLTDQFYLESLNCIPAPARLFKGSGCKKRPWSHWPFAALTPPFSILAQNLRFQIYSLQACDLGPVAPSPSAPAVPRMPVFTETLGHFHSAVALHPYFIILVSWESWDVPVARFSFAPLQNGVNVETFPIFQWPGFQGTPIFLLSK